MEGSWPKFLAKNIFKIILLTIGISMMTFGLMKASPVDPLQANDPGRPDLSCHTSGADLKYYRCLQHRPAHPGKNDGYHGKRLCFVCQDAGGERMAPV